MAAHDPSAPILGPVLITFAIASIPTGLVLCGFGMTRMGRAIRYVPYPVVGGFLGATGCLILLGSIRVVTGMKLQFATLDRFANMQTAYELAAAGAMALVLYLTWHRSRTPFGLPLILIGGTLAAHVAFHLAGISIAQAQALGWTFQSPPHVSPMLPWSAHEIEHYPWYALPDVAGNIIAVMFVTASSTLFNTTGVEVAANREANLERELNTTGIANMLSGVFAGYTGCISVSRTMLNFSAGGSGRLSGLTSAVIAASMLLFAPVLLGYMPKFVLGGLLLYLGADTLHRWIVQSRRRLSLTEYLSLLAIIVIILQWGFVAGILIGVVIGCTTFALSASRIDSIKFSFDGSEYRSSLDRAREDLAVLSAHGGKIQGLNQLTSSTSTSRRCWRNSGMPLPAVRFPAPDRHRLIGCLQLRADQARDGRSRHSIGAGASARHGQKALRSTEFITRDVSIVPELDDALEWCENEIITQLRTARRKQIARLVQPHPR